MSLPLLAAALLAPAPQEPLVSDPAVPLIQLPTRFSSRRSNSDRAIGPGGSQDLARLKGPGCVRHIWLLPGDDTRLVIHVDGAEEPQVDVPVGAFFGQVHGWGPYPVECAAYSVFPNPLPGMPGTPGYNLHLPIPFAESCTISLTGPEGQRAVAMVDWQRYGEGTALTPYRLHATHRLATPAAPRGGFHELASLEGRGFVAGVVAGYLQRDHRDMVFHTGGMTLLLDGETDPHVIRGHNVEDDFGFTWGFNAHQTLWHGCPYHVNRGRTDQDGVFYRFFGPDPIAFESSLVFRTGARGDDVETVVYSYQVPGTSAPGLVSPTSWQAAGLFPDAEEEEAFRRAESIEAAASWSQPLLDGERELVFEQLTSTRGWVDLGNVFYHRHHTATPLTHVGQSAYLRTTLEEPRAREATLRLTLDDRAVVWLNGERLAEVHHGDGLETVRLPVRLREGPNQLQIKTSNSAAQLNKALWALHLAVED